MATPPGKEKPSLCLVRHYKATPEKIWQAWTDPEALKQWFRPDASMTTPETEVDVRVGGQFYIKMKSGEGEEHHVSGIYKEVIPNRKLVFTWTWKSTPERESLVTIELEPTDDGTELTLRHEQFTDEETRDLHEDGWTGALGQLESYL